MLEHFTLACQTSVLLCPGFQSFLILESSDEVTLVDVKSTQYTLGWNEEHFRESFHLSHSLLVLQCSDSAKSLANRVYKYCRGGAGGRQDCWLGIQPWPLRSHTAVQCCALLVPPTDQFLLAFGSETEHFPVYF